MKLPIYSPTRTIPNKGRKVFLTFDDGPTPDFTPQVLDVLKEKKIQATFFLIAEKAILHSDLVKKILEAGHAIGDHSLDHKYSRYFSSKKNTRKWIEASQTELGKFKAGKPLPFRSPAGVWTPKLAQVLKELGIPWVHWDIRFYDTQYFFTKALIDKKIKSIQEGSIILLHDSQKKDKRSTFLHSLDYLIETVHRGGFIFDTLKDQVIASGAKQSPRTGREIASLRSQ